MRSSTTPNLGGVDLTEKTKIRAFVFSEKKWVRELTISQVNPPPVRPFSLNQFLLPRQNPEAPGGRQRGSFQTSPRGKAGICRRKTGQSTPSADFSFQAGPGGILETMMERGYIWGPVQRRVAIMHVSPEEGGGLATAGGFDTRRIVVFSEETGLSSRGHGFFFGPLKCWGPGGRCFSRRKRGLVAVWVLKGRL